MHSEGIIVFQIIFFLSTEDTKGADHCKELSTKEADPKGTYSDISNGHSHTQILAIYSYTGVAHTFYTSDLLSNFKVPIAFSTKFH